jgi:hypothetical protein
VRRNEARPSPRPATAYPVPACSTTYGKPDPKRPVVRLTFDVDESHAEVTGTERVTFTPDLPVTEVVFRLWPNTPGPVTLGGSLVVDRASLPMTLEPAGNGDGAPGTLLRLALPRPSPAGRAITVDLAFTLTLPNPSFDRWGHTAETAWWGSSHPVLAWVRGSGWATDAGVGIIGETQVSEVADYDVTVEAPPYDTVVGGAATDPPVTVASGRKRWHFRNDRARDVAVAVGRFAVRRVLAGDVPVDVAVSAELAEGGAAEAVFGPVVQNAVESVAEFVRRFGDFPYDSLTVAALQPVADGGVEYPGIVFVGEEDYDFVVPHEVAHEWFYGLVGVNQARDPWLDEAFATFGEVVFNHREHDQRLRRALGARGDVGQPMTHWDRNRDAYGATVYRKGAAALLAARAAVGEAAFDGALRCYVARMAYRVATPADLATALASLPPAVDVLREAGAL